MTKLLCGWLGIKPGYIGLKFEDNKGDEPDGKRHVIFVETPVLINEYKLGAFLAFALTQFLVEERKQIKIFEKNQQYALLTNASVLFGLGLVIVNGVSSHRSVLPQLHRSADVLKGFPYENYLQLLRNFVRKYRIEPTSFNFSLLPRAVRDLAIPPAAKTTHAVRDLKHQLRTVHIKQLGVVWVGLMLLGVGLVSFWHRVVPPSASVREAQSQTVLLEDLVKRCQDSLTYQRQYAQHDDIQTVRTLNAEELRCQSLQNQYDDANQTYKTLNP